MNEPLAIKLRPQTLNDVVGQTHLIGENKILSNICDLQSFLTLTS